MKKRICFGIALILTSSSAAFAEFPEKPTHANMIKAQKKLAEANKSQDLANSEIKAEKDKARAMLVDKENDASQGNVLNKTKSGRLAESNKHLTK